MKPETSTASPRTKKYLVSCLAALMAVSAPMGFAADSDALKKLQEENAALRKRLAALEGSTAPAAAPTTTTTTTTAPAATRPAMQGDEGVQTLTPFEVTSEKDNGYLRTNSVTATRINMPIQNIPISVSVMSKEFLDDANIRSITDILRYSSSGSGDNRFAMVRPANSATPQGSFTLRGFPINSLLRNGVSRYVGYNVNNVDRIEIVKGPASVFFGAGYPGGVINYITKQPVFAKIPTTISYTFGDNNTNRVLLDNNTQLSKKAAMRVVGSWENSSGARNFEYNKTSSLTANLSLIPFDSNILKLSFEAESYESKYNVNAGDWIYPDGWFQAYQNPSAALIATSGVADATAYKARIFANLGQYIADVRNAAGDQGLPTYTKVTDGAYYTAKDGSRVHDKGFNYTNRGSFSKQKVDTTSFTVESSPTTWMDGRYVLTNENGVFDNIEGSISPNADGRTFNAQSGINSAGYYRKIQNHQFDLIFKATKWGVKNTLLVGGVFIEQMQQYQAAAPSSPNYSQIPGFSNPAGNPGVVVNGAIVTGGTFSPFYSNTNDVPVNQVIRDRFGVIKTVQQVFTQWDPGAEINPDGSRLVQTNRTSLDGYKTQDQSGYINYNASLLDDRLNILGGVRREMHRDSGQYLTANFPWYAPPPYAYTDQVTYPPTAYNYGPAYSGGYDQFFRQAGTSYMGGLSYQVVKDVNVFTSYSKTFRLNTGNAGGVGTVDVPYIWDAARTYLATQGKSSFDYNGKTIASAADLGAALAANGALTKVPNETGTNLELGVKTSLWDNKFVGTFSIFRSERTNQRYDDTGRANAERLNFTNNLDIFGPAGTIGPDGAVRANSRVLRWRTTALKNRIEGFDFDTVFTPVRNFQIVVNGAWLKTAKTLEGPATTPKPGTAAYNAASAAAKVASDIFYGARIENVPEYRLNVTTKYTFTSSFLAGLSVGGSARYSSETVVSRDVNWNPLRGGFQAGNFLVFDGNASYPWEVLGYKISTNLGVYNLLDEKYFEGTYVASPRRNWLLTTTLKF